MPRYLPVDVYSNVDSRDSSNNGVTFVSSRCLVVPCEDGHITEEDVVEHGMVVLELKPSSVPGYPPKFVPRGEKRWTMFGGNFVYTSDSRFGKKYGHSPVKVHDRIE